MLGHRDILPLGCFVAGSRRILKKNPRRIQLSFCNALSWRKLQLSPKKHCPLDFHLPGASHDSPRTPNVHISGPGASNTTKIQRKEGPLPPRERRKKEKCGGRRKKSAKCWPPHPSGPPPFGASTLRGLHPSGHIFSGIGPHLLLSQNSTSKKLTEVEQMCLLYFFFFSFFFSCCFPFYFFLFLLLLTLHFLFVLFLCFCP